MLLNSATPSGHVQRGCCCVYFNSQVLDSTPACQSHHLLNTATTVPVTNPHPLFCLSDKLSVKKRLACLQIHDYQGDHVPAD